jgi:phosphatidylglycerophosphate synthase
LATVLGLALMLDGVDGFLARRHGLASEFGAAFDTETDAGLVMILGLAVWERQGVGAWVLLPGVLHYAYVLCLVLFPPSGEKETRSLFACVAFGLVAGCLLLALVMGGALASACAALATLISCLSFARSFLVAYPMANRVWQTLRSGLVFLLAWSLLNIFVNLRFPAPEPAGWYFLPSIDVTVLLAVLALVGLVGWRLPWGARVALLSLLLSIRVLRIGDGITGQYFGQLFTVYTDVPLVPELVRYAHSTYAPAKFYAGAVAAVAAIVLLCLAVDRALAFSAAYLRHRHGSVLFAAIALPFAVASLFIGHDARYNQRYVGAFGASAVPRLQREATFLLNVYDHRAKEAQAIASTQALLRATPADLARLHHANIYLLFVESYGATAIDRPVLAARVMPALKATEADLARQGFSIASGRLDSATYGGMSWLAHATLLTGVRTANQLEYDLLGVSHPRSLARIAHEAGYHTVLVQPNTNRRSRTADFYDFDDRYNSWNFDYSGPAFAWATMPDQYVLDFIRRRAIAPHQGPLFLTYVLVSSHAPWSRVPTLVPDWSQLGTGEVFDHRPVHRAATNWPNFANASQPYSTSIAYDLEVLDSYVTQFVTDDSLIVILGDHQPVSELTDNSPSYGVPIHVISRRAEFIAPFLARGYVHGMVPGTTAIPMEAFLVDFLHDFSEGAS